MMKTVVVIPAFNESENIIKLITEIEKFDFITKIVVVDDSPNTLTLNIFQQTSFTKTKLIQRNYKQGRGSAVLRGMYELITEDFKYLVEMDADFSHSPNEIRNLLSTAEENGAHCVIASRYVHGSKIINWPLSRKIFSKMANKLAKKVIKTHINDYTNGFRIYKKEAVEIIIENCGRIGDGFIILSEIIKVLYKSNLQILEVKTVFINRIRGESSLTFKEIKNSLNGLLMLRKIN